MPRLRVVKKPNESADIPEADAIQVELEQELSDETKESQVDLAAQQRQEDKEKKVQEESEEVITLKKQLEDVTKAVEEHKKLAEQAQRERQAAVEHSQKRDAELTTAGDRVELAELDAINNAIAAAESEAGAAASAWSTAKAAEDLNGEVDAQRRLARAETRLVQLEDGKASIEARREWQRVQPKKAPQPQTLDTYIDTLPLNGSQKDWLKKHPELMQDPKKNVRLQNAHYDAEEKGLVGGSEAYFKYVEERLGYRQAETEVDDVEEVDDKPERKAIVSAPVSRNPPNSSGRPSSTRITLSPEQRSAAKAAGVDEVTYAKQLIKLQEMKRSGHYSEN